MATLKNSKLVEAIMNEDLEEVKKGIEAKANLKLEDKLWQDNDRACNTQHQHGHPKATCGRTGPTYMQGLVEATVFSTALQYMATLRW